MQHHAVLDDGRPLLAYPGFDACSEFDFDSPDAMDEGFARAAATGALRADEDRFVDKQRYSWVLGEADERAPHVEATDPVTLVTWWRSHPASQWRSHPGSQWRSHRGRSRAPIRRHRSTGCSGC